MGCYGMVTSQKGNHCFCKAGILGVDTCMSVVEHDEQDPFSEADEYMALKILLIQTMNTQETCPLQEYLNGEDYLHCSCVQRH